MHKRFIVTTVLGVALLFSQGGSTLIAALCPHLQSGMVSCESKPSSSTSHEGMAHEDMGHTGHTKMQHETVGRPDPDAVAMSQSHEPCLHCSVHSSRTPTSASLRETEAAKRSIDLTIPLHLFRV